VIRRRYGASENILRVADLEINTGARSVRRNGTPVALSGREYALLEYLARRKGHVVSRTEIREHVYDFASEPASNVVDVYIGYLRKKLEVEPGRRVLHTRRGFGYLLGDDEP
jgi:DNA-binding response OmpR family regulator